MELCGKTLQPPEAAKLKLSDDEERGAADRRKKSAPNLNNDN